MKNTTLTVTCAKEVDQGQGLAYWDKKPVFVSRLLKDEEALVTVFQQNKKFSKANILELKTKSPLRIKPRCQHYELCGGCDYQHLADWPQQELKKQLSLEKIKRAGLINEQTMVEFKPVNQRWNYRNRVQIHYDHQNLKWGFFKKSSHQLFELKTCHLLPAPTQIFFEELTQIEPSALQKLINTYLKALNCHQTTQVTTTTFQFYHLASIQASQPQLVQSIDAFITELKIDPESLSVIEPLIVLMKKHGILFLPREHKANFFCQNHPEGNQIIKQEVQKIIRQLPANKEPLELLEFFSGTDNLLWDFFIQSPQMWNYQGFEANPSASKLAQQHWQKNKNQSLVTQTRQFWPLSFEQAFLKLLKHTQSPKTIDLLLLDPPRQGIYDSLPQLKKLNFKQIIWISCDLATGLRDMQTLQKVFPNLQIKQITVIDIFPQTHHVETIFHGVII